MGQRDISFVYPVMVQHLGEGVRQVNAAHFDPTDPLIVLSGGKREVETAETVEQLPF